MFTKITPQKVQHDSGYIVQTGSRDSLQYLDDDILVEVKADFGHVTTIYPRTLMFRKGEIKFPPSPEEHKLILKHIMDALDFLGEKFELWD